MWPLDSHQSHILYLELELAKMGTDKIKRAHKRQFSGPALPQPVCVPLELRMVFIYSKVLWNSNSHEHK